MTLALSLLGRWTTVRPSKVESRSSWAASVAVAREEVVAVEFVRCLFTGAEEVETGSDGAGPEPLALPGGARGA